MTQWDLSEPVRKDRPLPWFLPSINKMFCTPLGRSTVEQRKGHAAETIPDPGQLNFLLKDSFFYYPRALYSAGVAELDIKTSTIKDKSILKRDRLNTLIMADSAGYQVATNALEIDWDNPTPTLETILRWQEHMADVGMYLDIPSRIHAIEEFETKKNGVVVSTTPNRFFGDKDGCLRQSLENYTFFAEQSPQIPMILPIHGDTAEEAIQWYLAVKKFPCCGYAVGAPITENYAVLITLIDYIARDGGFEDGRDEFFHIFGCGSPADGVVLTALQLAIRNHISPNLRITFDASSPIKAGGKHGKVYENAEFLPHRQMAGQSMESFCEKIKGLNREHPYAYAFSPVLDAIKLKDLLRPTRRPKLDGTDREMDGLSYTIIASHNVFVLVQTIYMTIDRVLNDYRNLISQLEAIKGGTRDYLDPYVDWDDVALTKDAAAFFFTLLTSTQIVFSQKSFDRAWQAVDELRARSFDKAL